MEGVLQYLRERTFLELSLYRLALGFLIIIAGLILRTLLSTFLLNRLIALTRRTRTDLDDLLIEAARRPVEGGVVLIALAVALNVMALPTEPVDVQRIAHILMVLALTALIAWLLFRLIDAFGTFFERRARATDTRLDDALVPLIRKAIKIFIAVLVFIVVVQNLGYSISGILAGLGIGGLALALAAKDTLANIFGAIAILLDRPFQVGDWVRGPDFDGVIEDIGFRSTRIRTFPKTLVSVPNSQLVNMVVDNQQQMPVRRMDIDVGVTYDTTSAQMRRALAEIEALVRSTEGIVEDGLAIRFREFGASSLNLHIKCFTRGIDYDSHSAVRQEVLLGVMEKLEELGLEMAFPSQTLYFGKGQTLTVQGDRPELTPPS